MNILIRCDSSNIIGTGHVMRCLNMCEYHPKNKYTFVCKNYSTNISNKITHAGHCLILLDYSIEPILNDYKSWLGDNEVEETKKMVDIISKNKFDEIFIDHYGYDATIEKELSNLDSKIVILTDIFDFKHYCDEMIIFSSDDLEKIKKINLNPNTIIKCGVENIIINKKFKQFKKIHFNDKIQKICIMLGGTDPLNYTLEIIKKIDQIITSKNINVIIVIGKSNSNIESIKNFIGNNVNYNLLFDLNYDDLIKLYLDIDLCIGSLSVTAYERLFMNIPQICLKIVDNQNIQQLQDFNICTIDTLISKLSLFL